MNTFKNLMAGTGRLVKRLLVCLFLALLFVLMMGRAQAQYDYYATPRNLVVTANLHFLQSGTTTLAASNVVDISRFEGIAKEDINVVSNTAGLATAPVITVVPLMSDNGTNAWRPATNYSIATINTLFNTNYFGTSNASYTISTNTWLASGTITNQAVSAGFAGQYIIAAPFTNSGGFVATPGAIYEIGFATGDQAKYHMLQYIGTGTNFDYSISAMITGRTKQGIYY